MPPGSSEFRIKIKFQLVMKDVVLDAEMVLFSVRATSQHGRAESHEDAEFSVTALSTAS